MNIEARQDNRRVLNEDSKLETTFSITGKFKRNRYYRNHYVLKRSQNAFDIALPSAPVPPVTNTILSVKSYLILLC